MSENKRKRYLAHYRTVAAISEAWRLRGFMFPPPIFPPLPYDLRDMACGARTRAGTPCKLKSIYANGRCKFHGGCSTGPKTELGKAQARINGMLGGRPKKPKS